MVWYPAMGQIILNREWPYQLVWATGITWVDSLNGPCSPLRSVVMGLNVPSLHLSTLLSCYYTAAAGSSTDNSRVMWKMPSQALMWDRKAFPSPCPAWAPFTRPAMSTMFRKAGTLLKETKTARQVSQWDRNPWILDKLQPAVTVGTHCHNTHLTGLWYWQRKS